VVDGQVETAERHGDDDDDDDVRLIRVSVKDAEHGAEWENARADADDEVWWGRRHRRRIAGG
jgi:hypothetical protein